MLTFIVHDLPAPQGSKKGYYNKHIGRVQLVESSAKVKPWREAVKQAALDALTEQQPAYPRDWPMSVTITFTLPRPKGHYRTGRNAHLLRDSAPIAPASKPDLDKLVRSTLDALTAAGVYVDDSQVVELHVAKGYPCDWRVDSLHVPGAVIHVAPIVRPDYYAGRPIEDLQLTSGTL